VLHWPNPGGLYLFGLAFAVVGTFAAALTAAVLTLSLKSAIISPDDATTVLSIAVGTAGLVTLIAYPLIGRISDRTTGRLGRRRPFLILGAVLIGGGSVLLVVASDIAMLTLGNMMLATGASAVVVAATATVAEQFEPTRRGLPSAILGLGTPAGALLGLILAQSVSTSLPAMILVPGAVGVAGPIVFACILKDRSISAADLPALRLSDVFGTFWVNPAKAPDYAWVWFSRLLIFIGIAAINAYQAFYLIIHLHVSPENVWGAILLGTAVLVGVSLVFAPLMAKISDRIGRRKPFVIAAALIFAAGLGIVATASTFAGFLVAIAVLAVGQGVYLAVDISLATQVLPDPNSPAKDLGILNLASQLPSFIVPAVAPILLTVGASAETPQNFTALFLAGAAAALVGALLILPVRTAC
jgi:MFS family permease